MRDIRPSIYFSRSGAAFGLVLLVGLSGCTIEASRLDSVRSMFEAAPTTTTAVPQPKIQPVGLASPAPTALKPQLRSTVIADGEAAIGSAKVVPAADHVPPVEAQGQSSWCTSLRETAMANGNILRSPLLGGSYDNNGKAELSLGLSYSQFHRADLLAERAEVECRRYIAQTGLQRLVFTAPQNITAAGFAAKANAIDNAKFELVRLKQSIKSHLNRGDINSEKATSLLTTIDQLHAEGEAARSQSSRRIGNILGSDKPALALGADLLRAEQDLDQLDSQIRTSENFDVGVEGLYSEYTNGVPNGASTSNQGFGGKVSFSMKLGVIDPRRFEHERLASAAKQRAIGVEGFGPLWQANQLRRSTERAIAGLEQSRLEISKAVAEAKHLLATMVDVTQPEFVGVKINAQLQLLKFRAEEAAVSGSLIDMQRNLKQLANG